MKIIVTGGTGFVGSHSVAALVRRGHTLRLLVRSAKRVRPALDPLGVESVEIAEGDVTDRAAVERAMVGCDAVLHGASVYSFDIRNSAAIRAVNVAGTENVLGTAARMGLDPIAYISSFVALLPGSRGPLTTDSDVGDPRGAYARSKAAAERVARRFQADGAPVVITYPGSVWGPCDPHLGESATLALDMARGRVPFLPSGGFPICDVRDVAAVHAALMEPGRGPRRYLAAGPYIQLRTVFDTVCQAAGRRRAAITLPAPVVLGFAWAAQLVQRFLPVRLPISFEAPWVAACRKQADSSRTEADLGVEFRPAGDAIRDTVRWLQQTGKLPLA